MFISGTTTAYEVLIRRNVLDHRYDFGVRGHIQLYLKSVLLLIMRTTLTLFDREYSYLAQLLPMMLTLQRMFQIIDTLKAM